MSDQHPHHSPRDRQAGDDAELRQGYQAHGLGAALLWNLFRFLLIGVPAIVLIVQSCQPDEPAPGAHPSTLQISDPHGLARNPCTLGGTGLGQGLPGPPTALDASCRYTAIPGDPGAHAELTVAVHLGGPGLITPVMTVGRHRGYLANPNVGVLQQSPHLVVVLDYYSPATTAGRRLLREGTTRTSPALDRELAVLENHLPNPDP